MLPSLHIPLAQSSQSNRLTMKRKFGLGHLKVAPSTTVNNAENWDTLDKCNSRDDYTYTHVPLAPSLDAKTENELRKACAFILKDLKPSGHDLEDTRMKTDILLGTDGLGQDNRNLLPGDVRSSATQNKHWPLSKRDANRSKDRSGREKSLLENSLDSWGEERVDGRTSRSTNRQAQPPNQTRRRAPTAVAEEEELPFAPLEFLPKCVEPIPKPKEEEETFRNNAPHIDSSENSSLGQSVGSITQIRSTSTGITSAVITPAWPSQRTSENGIGSVVLSNPALTSTSVTNRQVKTQQPPERPKTPSMVTTSMELGSNLEAQAVPIISRRARSRGPGEPTDSQVVWKNKSLSDLRSATPKVEVPLRPLTPEPSRARSLQRTGIVPSAASISVNSLTAQSQPSQVLSQIRAPGAPPLFDTDDSSSVTDDDSSSQEDKEHYLLDTNTPSADESAASTAPQVINTEKVLKQNDMNEVESSKEADEEVTSPQPVVNPKNPLRYSEIEAPLASKEQKLSHDIRDKSEEPLATARARIDAREHSRRTSALLDLQQPILEQQGNDPMWESDAKPQPLNLKSKASSTNLGASPTEGTRPAELPVLSQTLAFDPSRNVPIHVPSPLPPLKHEHDESITVKDFWKPTPKPQISESVRSFSRPGTGGGTTQHRRQPAQESIEGLVQPLRSFSPVTSELSYSPIQAGQSWSAEYVPTRSSDRVAVAGPSSQAGYKRHASLTRGVQDVYRPPVISIQPGTAAAAPSSTHPRLSSMATSTHPRLGSMATSTHPRLSSIASSTHPRLNSMGNSSTTPRRSPRQQHQKHQHQHQYRPSTDSTSAAPPPDIDHFYNQYVQSHKNLDPAKAAPVVQPSLGNSGGAYHYNYTSSPPPKGGIKKLLHRLGGGDMPDRRRGVGGGAGGAGGGGYGGGGYGGGGYGGGGHGGGGYGGGIGMQAAAAAAAAAGEEGEDYYDEDDDDLACEAPVVRFGRGW